MSSIYFHSQSEDDVQIRGSERAWFGSICSQLFCEFLDLNRPPFDKSEHPLKKIINPEHYVAKEHNQSAWLQSIQIAASLGRSNLFIIDGKPVDLFYSQLNTAWGEHGSRCPYCEKGIENEIKS